MKKMMMICLFVLGITAVGHAQNRMRMSPEDRAKQMQEQLKLTDDQTTKITAIFQAQAKSIDSLRNAGVERSQMRPIMQAATDKVKAILTPEQLEAWQKRMQEMRAQRQGGGGR